MIAHPRNIRETCNINKGGKVAVPHASVCFSTGCRISKNIEIHIKSVIIFMNNLKLIIVCSGIVLCNKFQLCAGKTQDKSFKLKILLIFLFHTGILYWQLQMNWYLFHYFAWFRHSCACIYENEAVQSMLLHNVVCCIKHSLNICAFK